MKNGLLSAEVIGNLTDNAKLGYTTGGTAVANFTVAVNTTYRDREGGTTKQTTDFVKVSMFGKRAESLEKYLTKGLAVRVSGKPTVGKPWEKSSGEMAADLILTVGRDDKDFMFIGGGSVGGHGDDDVPDIPTGDDDQLFVGEPGA